MGRKAPAESAERMAKRAPHTVLENRRFFSSIGMVISPAEMHQSSGDDQNKSISGLLDNTTLIRALDFARSDQLGSLTLLAAPARVSNWQICCESRRMAGRSRLAKPLGCRPRAASYRARPSAVA